MNCDVVMKFLELVIIFQALVVIQASHVRDAKARIQGEVRHAIGHHNPPNRKEISEIRHDIRHNLNDPRKWSHRRRQTTYYTPWTKWSRCDPSCRQVRSRFCKAYRKCGETKHTMERRCNKCSPSYHQHNTNSHPESLHSPGHTPFRLPVYQEIPKNEDTHDYFVIKKYKKKRKPIFIEVDDYQDLEDEEDTDDIEYSHSQVRSIRTKNWKKDFQNFDTTRGDTMMSSRKNLHLPPDTGFDYDDEHEEYGKDNGPNYYNNEYDNEYDEGRTGRSYDNRTSSPRATPREKAVFELPPRYKRVYSRWSKWSKCSPKCTTRRYKKCRLREICGKEVLREIAYCYTEGSFCQEWLEGQVHKTPPYDLKPVASSRKDVVSPNAIANDFILSGKGYRGPEYTPLKLKCGVSSVRNNRRNNVYNMLKIIGGKTARKGQWPWQVVIFNRFKEAFCGGTLIAPNWVLTAAHCVRKVLYVRLGEHNLDIEDGSEVEFRVVKSIKHQKYNKTTVDSDVALLRLPRPMNATNWIGFACMPSPYQPLPKNIQCTVIGWGKRRNRDQAGTSLLHQAEVPIIPMDNCKAVYYDYTITKNMFCAGHKRGRIDTCAGDSGGPLLCRDTTKPNHPWTIFGITSFGDGCAKKNKFGIYAKVPNYVDWVWSVVNCNGNCKPSHKRT